MSKKHIIPYNPRLKEFAKKLRKKMTLAEVLLWNELKRGRMMGLDFTRQRPIDNYIVDFYCKDLRLAIEVDGKTHYSEEVNIKDVNRQNKLESLGVHFLRFDDFEVKNELKNVIATIEGWINENGSLLRE